MKIKNVIIMTVFVSLITLPVVSAEIFGPDPTPVSGDVWTPVDKCWVYDSYHSQDVGWYGIVYFITYQNQYGQHKIEKVDIDTWYNSKMRNDVTPSMYFQGGSR